MGINKLERVMWRIEKRNPGKVEVTNRELERCIMYECGTDPKTYKHNRRALIKLQWLKCGETKQKVRITGKHITES